MRVHKTTTKQGEQKEDENESNISLEIIDNEKFENIKRQIKENENSIRIKKKITKKTFEVFGEDLL